MRIKRLDIFGFKSFVDKTVITFPDPITAIVGPNGCGKSNVVDAMRWCMGEQSAKHLRGRSMEDVIFAGSESRGPANFAEVSLTFDAEAMPGDATAGGVAWGAAGPSEVMVTRRLFRDGTSEYLLNGVPCRLRDIVDFFLGTGVGSKAYAIIEQGRIGFIVSSKPEDRRGLIDEAAGITKYKAKKKLAERRMDGTRQHLLRVSDVLGEQENRLRSLRLQAQKAERYKRYKAELRDLDLWAASQRFLGFLAEEKSLKTAWAELEERHRSEEARVVVEEAEVQAERLVLTEEQIELQSSKEELFALSNKAALANERAQHHEDEAVTLTGRADAAEKEIAEIELRTADNRTSTSGLDAEIGRLEDDAESRRLAYEEQELRHEECRSMLMNNRRQLDEATAAAASAMTRAARLESDIESTTVRREDLRRRAEMADGEVAGVTGEVQTLAAEAEAARLEITALEASREQSVELQENLEERSAELKNEVARGELELETLREESHRRRSRLESLTEIQSRYESFQRGVKAIMKQYRGERLGETEAAADLGQDRVIPTRPFASETAIRGLVADIMQPPPELETAVEAVLGDRLGNIIVESQDVGVDAIEFLKSRSEGRSSFIPVTLRARSSGGAGGMMMGAHGELSGQGDAEMQTLVSPEVLAGEGVRGSLLELIGYDRQYHHVAAYLLGDVLVCETLRQALDLWRRTQTTKTIVTLEGEVVDPSGVVTGGSRESAVGVLSQKREMRELEEVVARIELDRQTSMGRLVTLKQELGETEQMLQNVVREAREDEIRAVGRKKDLERAERDRAARELRRGQIERNVGELRNNSTQTEQRLTEARERLETEIRVTTEAETRAGALRNDVSTMADQLDQLVEELTTLKVVASQAADRRTIARSNLERLARELIDLETRRTRLLTAMTEERARAEILAADAIRLREEAALSHGEAEARARSQTDREGIVEERNGLLSRREADLRGARQNVSRMAHELGGLQLKAQEATLRRKSLEEHMADRYRDVTLSSVVYDHHMRPPVGDVEEERMSELRGLIERMGEINLTAIEESAELQKRFDFLTAQKADLESAIAQLETAIEKINKASRKRFKEVFDAVNIKFQEVFPRCFGGGHARLHLTNPDDMLETGVEIIANPPGKKIAQNIELLSGGEKAMTAVALLFAIFLVKPSPFCLLDEVDAPLDEANVGRFNALVQAMTDRSQFIIISHNRRTMEIADRLCGVTMEEAGVSRLVAVNLRSTRKPNPAKTIDDVVESVTSPEGGLATADAVPETAVG